MTSELQMSYRPEVGDKVRFLMPTYERSTFEFSEASKAEDGDEGIVTMATDDIFYVTLTKDADVGGGVVVMRQKASVRIPHDLMRIECYEPVPTPCYNQVDVDAVMRRCGEKPSCHDVELKVLTVMEMCRELRRYRLEEKERAEDGE